VRVLLETDEAWSIMTLVVSQAIDSVELSEDGKAALKKWRTEHADTSGAMGELADAMNETLGNAMDERTAKLLRRRGRYVSTRDLR
jgi:hypothetical protein